MDALTELIIPQQDAKFNDSTSVPAAWVSAKLEPKGMVVSNSVSFLGVIIDLDLLI